MSARDRILGRVRAAQSGDTPRLSVPRPAIATLDGDARVERFMHQATAADATLSVIASIDDLPTALATELRDRNMAATIRMGNDADFARLDWGTIEVSQGAGRIEEPATLSRAKFAMAEMGSLVLTSGPDNPVTLTFLGEAHFIVIKKAEIMAGFEDMWAAYRASGLDPRTVNMVTGPSRSADIGQTLQLGAHGPVALHIFVVDA